MKLISMILKAIVLIAICDRYSQLRAQNTESIVTSNESILIKQTDYVNYSIDLAKVTNGLLIKSLTDYIHTLQRLYYSLRDLFSEIINSVKNFIKSIAKAIRSSHPFPRTRHLPPHQHTHTKNTNNNDKKTDSKLKRSNHSKSKRHTKSPRPIKASTPIVIPSSQPESTTGATSLSHYQPYNYNVIRQLINDDGELPAIDYGSPSKVNRINIGRIKSSDERDQTDTADTQFSNDDYTTETDTDNTHDHQYNTTSTSNSFASNVFSAVYTAYSTVSSLLPYSRPSSHYQKPQQYSSLAGTFTVCMLLVIIATLRLSHTYYSKACSKLDPGIEAASPSANIEAAQAPTADTDTSELESITGGPDLQELQSSKPISKPPRYWSFFISRQGLLLAFVLLLVYTYFTSVEYELRHRLIQRVKIEAINDLIIFDTSPSSSTTSTASDDTNKLPLTDIDLTLLSQLYRHSDHSGGRAGQSGRGSRGGGRVGHRRDDTLNLGWINTWLQSLWTVEYDRGGVGTYLSDTLERTLNWELAQVPQGVALVAIKKCSLGRSPPVIRAISSVYKIKDDEACQAKYNRSYHMPAIPHVTSSSSTLPDPSHTISEQAALSPSLDQHDNTPVNLSSHSSTTSSSSTAHTHIPSKQYNNTHNDTISLPSLLIHTLKHLHIKPTDTLTTYLTRLLSLPTTHSIGTGAPDSPSSFVKYTQIGIRGCEYIIVDIDIGFISTDMNMQLSIRSNEFSYINHEILVQLTQIRFAGKIRLNIGLIPEFPFLGNATVSVV